MPHDQDMLYDNQLLHVNLIAYHLHILKNLPLKYLIFENLQISYPQNKLLYNGNWHY